MHYTCVQNPRKYFHDICTTLPKSVQTAIAAFFQATVNLPQLTRHHLRETIINVNIESSIEDGLELLSESNSGSSTPSSDIKTVDTTDSTRTSSLSKKWIKPLASSPIVTPPTPKTELLEQRTRELRGLRVSSSFISSFRFTISQISSIHSQAQLETERYEKIILEEQILENEQLINSLTRGTYTLLFLLLFG